MFAATADVEHFDEAVSWFRDRMPFTQELIDALGEYAGSRSWTISGVSQLDIVLHVFERLQSAIEKGTPFSEFQDEVEASLTEAWGRKNSSRIELIFRNAVQSSLNAGRWRQMQDPEVKALRPFVLYDAILDQRTSPICRELDGTIVDIDSAWLESHHPPLHHACRSQLVSLRAKDANRRGITDKLPTTKADKGFGDEPTASSLEPKASDYPDELFAEYRQKRRDLEENAPRKMVRSDAGG